MSRLNSTESATAASGNVTQSEERMIRTLMGMVLKQGVGIRVQGNGLLKIREEMALSAASPYSVRGVGATAGRNEWGVTLL